jgi:NAD+ synthase (glutamine-hydrolysing)
MSVGQMRLALAQINSVVGDIDGNTARVAEWLDRARTEQADLVLFPELVITGYPAEDLLLRPGFVRAARSAIHELAKQAHGVTALVGAPHLDADLYNACFVLAHGEVRAVYRKRYLPNYGVFDEDRYFAPGNDLLLLRFGDVLVGPTVCEDLWQPGPPATDLALAGAHLIANISASPFHIGKDREREEMFQVRARDNTCFVALCNAVGGQDELIFDGHSVVLDDDGQVLARAAGFEEELLVVDVDPISAVGRRLRDVRRRALARGRRLRDAQIVELPPPRAQTDIRHPTPKPQVDDLEQMRLALELGIRDYVEKNGFGDIVVGVSGGIDSALTAALCVEAIGSERVHVVSMPSRYSSEGTRADARRLAESLGVELREISIEPMVEAYDGALHEQFAGRKSDLTEENLQARIRGTLLMALSNKFGWLVIATGNKSELSVGYSTLYGDLAGGFALIKDVYKTDVFRLACRLNERAGRELIPRSIIDRAPSAELRPDQLDEDSLPPYSKLDEVLEAYVELDRSREELQQDGFDRDVVERALAMIDRAEYKRRQAPPGVKLHPKAFGRDRRTPITNHWRN